MEENKDKIKQTYQIIGAWVIVPGLVAGLLKLIFFCLGSYWDSGMSGAWGVVMYLIGAIAAGLAVAGVWGGFK